MLPPTSIYCHQHFYMLPPTKKNPKHVATFLEHAAAREHAAKKHKMLPPAAANVAAGGSSRSLPLIMKV